MTPEEIEELGALVDRLGTNAYNENLAVILGAALEHIHMQDVRIVELESRCIYDPESGKIFVPDGHPELARLRSQVATLQEIAEEERACRLSSPDTGAIPTVEHYNALDPEGSILEARRQLSEEHPEAFR